MGCSFSSIINSLTWFDFFPFGLQRPKGVRQGLNWVKRALKAAQPELARGVTKGILHKNTVARKMSRLSSRVKAVAKV